MTTARCLAAALALGAAILATTALQSTPATAFPGAVMAGSDAGSVVHAVRDGGGISVDISPLDALEDLGVLGDEDDEYDNEAASECLRLQYKYRTTGKRYWLERYRDCLRDARDSD